MKKLLYISSAAVAVLALASCNKEAGIPEEKGPKEVVFNLDGEGLDFNVRTKATAVSSVPASLYWCATTGTRGQAAEAKKWADNAGTAKAVSSGKLSTGKYLAASPVAHNYYVANGVITAPATGNVKMTVANNNVDVIAGWVAASASAAPAITLNHLFARTGSLTCNTQSGYSISGVSWKIVGKSAVNGTAGVYNLSTGAWESASTKLASDVALTSSSDMYLLPGTYTIKVTYTLTLGDWSQTFTKSGDVTLTQGKINNISCIAVGGSASQIILNVSLTAWASENKTLTLS